MMHQEGIAAVYVQNKLLFYQCDNTGCNVQMAYASRHTSLSAMAHPGSIKLVYSPADLGSLEKTKFTKGMT